MAKKQKVSVKGTVVTVEYPSIGKSVSCDLAGFSPELFTQAALHGVKQRLGDAASGEVAGEKYAMASRIVEAFSAGSWDIGSRETDNAIVLEAVARIKDIDVDEVQDAFNEYDEEKQVEKIKEWRAAPRVKAAIAEIRAERAAAAIDESEDDEIEL